MQQAVRLHIMPTATRTNSCPFLSTKNGPDALEMGFLFYPPTTDIRRLHRNDRFVPRSDIAPPTDAALLYGSTGLSPEEHSKLLPPPDRMPSKPSRALATLTLHSDPAAAPTS